MIKAAMAFAILWPLVSLAAGIDIPELGVHLEEVPAQTPAPVVTRKLDGYRADLKFGEALLTITRLEDLVPPGSGVSDASYHATLQADFQKDLGPKAHGQATTVDGREAWTTHTAIRLAPGREVHYSSDTYLIVNQHLYVLTAVATGEDTRPQDYIDALRAMSELNFVPIVRTAAAEAASGLLKRPPFLASGSVDWYPAAAVRRGEQGAVDFEFSIDSKGHAQDIQRTYAASEALGEGAQKLLESSPFRVNSNWEANGYQKLRFSVEVQFWLGDPARPCPEDVPTHLRNAADAQVVRICRTYNRRR